MTAPPLPTPQFPQRITPTRLASFTRCPARSGFEQDSRTSRLQRMGLRAALGVVAHAMLEREDTGVAFKEAWDEQVAAAYDKLRQNWAPAIPPSPAHWPGWALTRARLAQGWPGAARVAAPCAPAKVAVSTAGLQVTHGTNSAHGESSGSRTQTLG